MATPDEGWAKPLNVKKWHYFRGGRSLCGSWGYFGTALQEDDGKDHKEDCGRCLKKLRKEKKKNDS